MLSYPTKEYLFKSVIILHQFNGEEENQMKTRQVISIISVMLFCIVMVSCSKPPVEQDAITAITECGKKNMSMFGMMGKNSKIESVDIKEIGDFDKEKKGWPAKATVTLKYAIFGREQSIKKPGTYILQKDKQGKWTASQVDELMDALDDMGKALGL